MHLHARLRLALCAPFLIIICAHAQRARVGIFSALDSLHGLQVGLVSSSADGDVRGFQFGGMANMATGTMRGLQLAGVSNIASGMNGGLQLSSLMNVAANKARGMQLGVYNFADTLSGLQLGLINVTGALPHGRQIGIVNLSRDTVARKLGLVSIDPRTQIDYLLAVGTSSKTNVGVRFRNNSTYSQFSIGTHYMGLDRKFSGAITYRLGLHQHVKPRWTLAGDIGFSHIETFEKHDDRTPQRLFSLSARVGAEYRLGRRLGVYVMVGAEDAYYYQHARHYRTRPLVEAGIAWRHLRHTGNSSDTQTPQAADTLAPAPDIVLPQRPRPWRALAEMVGINAFVHGFDRFVLGADFAQVNLKTIGHNFEHGFVWDNDKFATNLFAHPYHGNLYYNAARSSGLSFWQAAPFAMGGSLMWEFCGETEPPAINDLIATTVGGIAIGEVAHRMSDVLLDDRSRGFRRFLREFAATAIDPIKGLNRLLTGDAWRVRTDRYRYHDAQRYPIDFSISAGSRYLADDGAFFKGEHNPYINLYLEYGKPLNEDANRHPYDFFSLDVTFGLSSNQPLVNRLHLLGRLWSTPMFSGRGMKAEFGIYQHFNYYDSSPVKDGTALTPYRISEAAAAGPGIIFSFPETGSLTRLEQRLFLSAILLGGSKSDYYSFIDRDYNMGSGYSIKSKTHMEMRHFGRFILHAGFYHLFTWKGYEQKDLTTVNPLYLNSQGDRGSARMLVINPIIEMDLREGWSLVAAASYFSRKSKYKYESDVSADTFEGRLGLTYHF